MRRDAVEELIVMGSGGARNRSGPGLDVNSGRSDARGISLTALPNQGYRGEVPEFPLPQIVRVTGDRKRRGRRDDEADEVEVDDGATEVFREREVAIWETMWRTPQAAAWSLESWRWETIAEFCRLKAVVELEPDANASLVGQMHRYRDQIGLTPAGLKENGWAIAVAQIGPAADGNGGAPEGKPATGRKSSSRSRMSVVKSDDAGA